MESTLRSMGEFGALVADVWKTGVLGVDTPTLLTALLIVIASLFLRGLFTRLVIWRLRHLMMSGVFAAGLHKLSDITLGKACR